MLSLRLVAAAAACCAAAPTFAQGTVAPASATTTIVVTGNPLGRDDLLQPASVLTGDALTERRAGTLGETLDGLPGVASSAFGPNSGRPVIRGLDGDRVRLLDNGGASVDASNLSFDHAVAIDPLAVERVEVLRGPAALLYGGNATGGVVNTIDNRIPRTPADGLSGRTELRLGGAAAERGGAALVEGGAGNFAWHADAFGRETEDQRVPDGRVRNSASRGEGGAVGAGWVSATGHLGASVDTYRNDYGVTAEEGVTIHMKRDRFSLSGEGRAFDGWFPRVSFQAGLTDYRHQELEADGAVGTTFSSKGRDLRVVARHRPLGPLEGSVGVQAEQLDFSALGEEAFVPSTRTRSAAAFVLEEWRLDGWSLSAGLRTESVKVRDLDGARERDFSPASASLGAQGRLGGGWQWTASLGHTERAPAYYELYADGLHVATGAYERGDPALAPERSAHGAIGLQWKHAQGSVTLDLYQTRFSNFIALDASGASIDTDEGPVPEFVFHGVRARMQGAELEARWGWADLPWSPTLTAGADVVRGRNLDTGEPLARLPPLRLRAGLELSRGPWRATLGVRHAADQARVPATDTATPGWTMLDASLSWQAPLAGLDSLVSLRLNNLSNRLAYSATTVGTLRPLAPLAGRALAATWQLRF